LVCLAENRESHIDMLMNITILWRAQREAINTFIFYVMQKPTAVQGGVQAFHFDKPMF